MKKAVTQKDIAKALGLSASTVALVVGGANSPLRKNLNKATIRRVERKAKEMGYEPNRSAQIIRRGRSNLIIFLYMAGDAEWVSRQAYQIGRIVHEKGYDYQTVNAYWWVRDGVGIINQLISLRPEGIIAAGSMQTQMDFSPLKRAGIPVVAMNTDIPDVSQVRHGVRGAIRELTLAAIAQGRRRPGFLINSIAPKDRLWQTNERLAGFHEAIQEAGLGPISEIELRSRKIPPLSDGPTIFHATLKSKTSFASFEEGNEAASLIGTTSDALICTNDFWALGAMTNYSHSPNTVPGEVVVSGFDNIIATTLGAIRLTTVEHPTEAMCEAAMRLLVEEMVNPEQKPTLLDFPCTVVWRESLPRPALELPALAHSALSES